MRRDAKNTQPAVVLCCHLRARSNVRVEINTGLLQLTTVMDLVVPDPTMLRVELPAAGGFVADDAVSTCPLLTPSPPTNALVDQISDLQEPSYIVRGDELATKLKQVEDEPNAVDSTSSNSSITAEPACVQLLNHHHYHHLTKNSEDGNMQENGIKQPPLQLTCGKADNFFFVNWNWPIIRKSCMWVFLSGLFGCLALVIAMVATLPRICNPPAEWYHGSLMYEVFPASFQDSNGDGIGDLKGLASRADYINSLGVRAVRLNSIFQAPHYPEGYHNITSLTKIDKSLGTLMDFAIVVNALHARNISLILDLPIWPLVKQLHPAIQVIQTVNKTDLRSVEEFIHTNNFQQVTDTEIDIVAEAIHFWLEKGVDGFYIKGLENYLSNDHFGESIKKWKKLIGPERVMIISHDVLELAPDNVVNILLNRVDLVDVKLDLESGTSSIRNQIESVHNSTLFTKPGTPWVHWSLGDVESRRLASRLVHGNATLGATLLQLMLPGTQNLFYGDEVGLQDVSDPEGERQDVKHIHQLAAMVWDKNEKQFTDRDVFPWMHGEPTSSTFPQRKLIAQMIKLRETSPAIYVNTLVKDGETKANAEVKYSQQDILVIQRWYPRRNSYVVVSNLGAEQFNADLSKMFYSGKVVVGPRADSECESISFKDIMLWPGESVVIELY